MSKFWNETTKNIEAYVPGEQPQDKKYIKLNTNENPYPPSQKVIDVMKNAVNDDLKLYPEPTGKKLITAISKTYNISENQIFVGNGSDEVLAFAFKAFFSEKKGIKFPDISYSFYPVYANLFNIAFEEVPLDSEFNIPLDKLMDNDAGVIIPNPNAPTGKYIDTNTLKDLLEKNKDNVVIIDEAYIDFGGTSMVKYINEYPNLLVVQTLSKSRSLAGLRCGFAMGHKDLIEGLNRVKNSINSYTLDRVALAGAEEAIYDKTYLENSKKIIVTRENTIKELEKLNFKVLDSKANFIFVTHKNVKADYLYSTLKDQGILVRYFNKPRINNYLRITIGTDSEMETLIEKLQSILK
ncbi:MAG: histidinol-phosphate transaminase [Clostridiales bacterium]|nr:histidinol-phosphate transaminase [Clostridiales bacterium]